MINSDHGVVSFDGDAIELASDLSTTVIALINTFKESGIEPEAANILMKPVAYCLQEGAKRNGYDFTLTSEDIRHYKRDLGLSFKPDDTENTNNSFSMELSGDALTRFLMGMD